MVKTINQHTKDIIARYTHLNIAGKSIQVPYFINSNRTRDLRAMIGKGTPDEIINEAQIWAKLKGYNFEEKSESEIKIFLQNQGIGIDCSGFVIQVLNYNYKKINGFGIWRKFKLPKSDFLTKLKFSLRPVENLGAEAITSNLNTSNISLKEIKPGDLIRSKSVKINGDHIMLITQVEYDDNNNLCKIIYTHSTPNFNSENGVKTGEIIITDLSKELEHQQWLELDSSGKNPTFEGYLQELEDNGIRRLNFSKELE